jgi:hypothetical protein
VAGKLELITCASWLRKINRTPLKRLIKVAILTGSSDVRCAAHPVPKSDRGSCGVELKAAARILPEIDSVHDLGAHLGPREILDPDRMDIVGVMVLGE